MILGIIAPSYGSYDWFGRTDGEVMRQKVGAILENPNFYPYLNGRDNLKIVADIKKVSYDKIDPTLERVGLLHRSGDKFRTYSLGMKQRLAIGAALLCDPEVLILDEPTNGLDPAGIAQIRQLITEVAQSGVTILLASHLLDEVEKVCTHVAVLKTGNMLYSGPVSSAFNSLGTIEVSADNLTNLRQRLEQHSHIGSIQQQGELLHCEITSEINLADLNRELVQEQVVPSHLRHVKPRLEDYFLEITK